MVYPTLNIDSLEKRCKSDLSQFYKLYNIDPQSSEFKEETSLQLEISQNVTKTNLEKKITEFVSRMKKMVESDVFDYAHNVVYLSDSEQKKLAYSYFINTWWLNNNTFLSLFRLTIFLNKYFNILSGCSKFFVTILS